MDATDYLILAAGSVLLAIFAVSVSRGIFGRERGRCPSCDSRDITTHDAGNGAYSYHCLRCWHVWQRPTGVPEPANRAEAWWYRVGETVRRRITAIATTVVTGILYVKLRRVRRHGWETRRDDTVE